MNEGKFFFEEDPESTANDLNWGEHAETFYEALKEIGSIQKENLAPHGISIDMQMRRLETTLIKLEFGVVKQDYVLHTIPAHHRKNFQRPEVLKQAMYLTVTRLQRVVPNDLQVDIFPPESDWQVKAISYVIRKGADAWNLDREKLESEIFPDLMLALTEMCNKL